MKQLKRTFALALPMMAGQLGQMLLGLSDTLMIGQMGTVELAASAFVNVLYHIPIVVGFALAAAVSVQVSHYHGAKQNVQAGEALRHGLYFSLGLGMATAVITLAIFPFLHWFGQPDDVVEAARPYLLWITLSSLPMMPTLICKSFADSKNHPWPIFMIMLAGVGVNILLNYLLIFGKFGFPEWGLTGAGIATFSARMLTLIGMWFYLTNSQILGVSWPKRWFGPIDRAECGSLINLGMPISGQILMEFGLIALTALFIGSFGAVSMASHQIAITCAATTFMLPMGLSQAVTIRVGHSLGEGMPLRCRDIVIGAHVLTLWIMGSAAILYLIFGEVIADAFTNDQEVVKLTATLLTITAIFQIFDGAQIISVGGLRGLKDVSVPTGIIFTSYWVITLPLGLILAFFFNLGAIGFWIALAAGLATAAFALTGRLTYMLKETKISSPRGKREGDEPSSLVQMRSNDFLEILPGERELVRDF
ncbi:MAG: MATE family efflux transporter [Verrucomicrobiota bacterium]